MKRAKILTCVAMGIVATMTVAGVGSASASSLCKVNEDPCSLANQASSVSYSAVGVVTILNSTVNVLCLNYFSVSTILASGSTTTIHPSEYIFTLCGTNAAHNDCTFTLIKAPLLLFKKIIFNIGTFKWDNALFHLKCTVLGFIKIDCEYALDESYEAAAEGALNTAGAGHGMITFKEAPALKVSGGALCPAKSTLDALLEPSTHLWITT